jgi:hypothetical protein
MRTSLNSGLRTVEIRANRVSLPNFIKALLRPPMREFNPPARITALQGEYNFFIK